MIRAIHFSAIALLAAASLVAATTAGSQDQIDASPVLSDLEQRSIAAPSTMLFAAGFGLGEIGDETIDDNLPYVTALTAERGISAATPNC